MANRASLLLPLVAAVVAPGPGPNVVPDFVHDVLPILQRQGCSSAYCHGAAGGQGGFKLSLFGSDPAADHAAITLALDARRLDLVDPDRSLLLAKPLLRMRHGGGRRLEADGPLHRTVRAWIAAGAPFRSGQRGRLLDLELRRGDGRLTLVAEFAGAGAADVSNLATFTTTDPGVVEVTAAGGLRETGPGEAWVLARYGTLTARLRVLRPFGAEPAAPPPPGLDEFDRTRRRRLAELGLAPAPPAPAATIARRLHLDLLGRPPSAFELRRFLAAPSHQRVADTAAALMASDEFAAWFGGVLARWLELPEAHEDLDSKRPRHDRIRARLQDAVAADRPLPELTAELLAAGSDTRQRFEDPRDRAEYFGRTLLGIRIGCARCHDHPHDRWRQADHLAFAACFVDPGAGATASGEAMLAAGGGSPAQLYDPATGDPVRPRLLPAERSAAGSPVGGSLPAAVHRFVHDPGHRLFARNFANRMFAILLGRGLVEPVDDHRRSNPAVHEEWLDCLAATFLAGGQRLRPLLLAIVGSEAYAAGVETGAADADAPWQYFAARAPRPLDAATLRRAIAAATSVDAARLPVLPDAPLARELALLNGPILRQASLDAPGNGIEALAVLGGTGAELLDELFLTCLSRLPRPAERDVFLPRLDGTGERGAVLRDLARALLLSREFGSLR